MGDAVAGIIVVGFNSGYWLESCFAALQAKPPPELDSFIVYVDNNSSDNSVQIVRRFSPVTVISLGKNVGFGAACNTGAREAMRRGATHLFFLNPDTRCSLDTVRACWDALVRNPRFGAVGPAQREYSSSLFNIWTRRAPLCASLHPTAHASVVPMTPDEFSLFCREADEVVSVSYVQGAALLIPAELFETCGGFDEGYFLFYEEVDLCRKLASLGYDSGMLPRVTIEHAWGGHATGERLLIWLHSRYRFVLLEPGRSRMAAIWGTVRVLLVDLWRARDDREYVSAALRAARTLLAGRRQLIELLNST